MTHQAVDQALVFEIEGVVFPAEADVTAGAARPVGFDADTEIVDQVALADPHGFFVPGYLDLVADQVPVGRFHDVLGGLGMALKASPRDRWAVLEWAFVEGAVVGMRRVFGYRLPWVRDLCENIRKGQEQGRQQIRYLKQLHGVNASEFHS